MGNKETATKLLLAMATAGLTTCDGIGAVDPAPPPLKCEDVAGGAEIGVSGTLNGQALSMTIAYNGEWGWDGAPAISAVEGMTVDSVDSSNTFNILVQATLDMGVTTAKFQVTGKVSDGEKSCDVSRTFTVTII